MVSTDPAARLPRVPSARPPESPPRSRDRLEQQRRLPARKIIALPTACHEDGPVRTRGWPAPAGFGPQALRDPAPAAVVTLPGTGEFRAPGLRQTANQAWYDRRAVDRL
jgi:hypothetical protein